MRPPLSALLLAEAEAEADAISLGDRIVHGVHCVHGGHVGVSCGPRAAPEVSCLRACGPQATRRPSCCSDSSSSSSGR